MIRVTKGTSARESGENVKTCRSLASGLSKHPDNKPDNSNHQNRSHPDSGFENISGYFTAYRKYPKLNLPTTTGTTLL